METAGVAIGVVSAVGLIGQIFDGCVKAYSYFTAAANLGKDSERLLCKIRIEEMRLMVWGREWGVKEGKLEAHLASSSTTNNGENASLKKLAATILQQLLDTIGDTKKLKDRYGIKEEGLSSSKGDVGPGRTLSSEGYISPTSPSRTWGDLKLRARWVVSDRDKFEVLLQDLKDYNDGLERLFPPSRIATLQRTWTNELLSTAKRDVSQLNLLETCSSGVYPQLTASANLKQLRINLDARECSKYKPTAELRIPMWSIKLDDDNEKEKDGNGDSDGDGKRVNGGDGKRVNGRYKKTQDSSEEQAVIIEWITYDEEDDLDTRLAILQRVDNLARMVHSASNRHPDLHTLDCMGYIADTQGMRYGLTYRCPEVTPGCSSPTSPLSPSSGPSSGSSGLSYPETLASLIGNPQNRTPYLNHRFELAHTLAVALWSFHSLDWLHKNFCPNNILFFPSSSPSSSSPTSPTSPSSSTIQEINRLSTPHVTGFDSSRPDYLKEMTIGTKNDLQQDSYRHPASLGIWRSTYRKSFDIYSLGLVLLEIGLWKSIQDFRKRCNYSPVMFRDKVVLNVLVPGLGSKTGRRYQSVVERCLLGSKTTGGGGGTGKEAKEAEEEDMRVERDMEWIVQMLESLRV
ncbi:MAG: Ribosome biogenesis protein erb1 [Watsoniomyces obsoletus]|nr:MAG: Ribosome biogenesis protein erb1 [Watsoniomyces obsoletus]